MSRGHPKSVFRTPDMSFHRNNFGGCMSKFCVTCNIEINRPRSIICKSCYFKAHHMRTYVLKKRSCEVCLADLTGTKLKTCKECNPISTCVDCNKKFPYKVRVKRCPACQYYWHKEKHPEVAEKAKKQSNQIFSDKRKKEIRDRRSLPHDAVLRGIGPKKEGYLNKKGYRLMIQKDDSSRGYRRVYQHVLIMESYLNRKLVKGETVHHKNGIRDDNRIDNLELWSKAQPAGQRVEDKIKWYIEFLMTYGYKVLKE